MIPERLVRFRLRTVLSLLVIIIAVAVVLEVIWIARHVLTWIAISLFLALALNPAVEWLQRRRGLKRRGAAAAVAYLLALGFIVAIGFTFVPTLVHQVNDFVNKLPDYAHDVTHGRGRLGFLETKYHIQERIRNAVSDGGATKVLGLSGVAALGGEERDLDRGRDRHDPLHDLLHAARGPELGRARLRPAARELAAALAQGRRTRSTGRSAAT